MSQNTREINSLIDLIDSVMAVFARKGLGRRNSAAKGL